MKAQSRNVRISPKKVHEVARLLRGRNAAEALDYLSLIPRKSARLLAATLRSAIANAENSGQGTADTLIISRSVVNSGVAMKRFKPGARGTAMPRKHRLSHLNIELSTKDAQ